MKKTMSLFTGFVFIAVLLIVSPGFARMNGVMGNGFSNGAPGNLTMGGCQCQTANLTTEQLATAKLIEDNYADQFTENARLLNAKIDEMTLVMANDQTTLAQINSLRAELYLLRQECRQLRSSVNQEIATTLGTAYGVSCGSEGSQYRTSHCGVATGTMLLPVNMGSVNGNYRW